MTSPAKPAGSRTVRKTLADGSIKEYRYAPRLPAAPRTVGWLIERYRQSAEFRALKPNTHRTYLRAFDHLSELHAVALDGIKRRHFKDLLDAYFDTPALANQIVSVLSVLMSYAVEAELIPHNPGTKLKRLTGGEHRRWTDDELKAALDGQKEWFRRAILLALYTGQRQGDCLRMTWADYDGAAIRVTQEKTGARLWIPCHADLRAELSAWERKAVTILVGRRGAPYTAASFATNFSASMKKLGLAGCTFHGLRKTAAAKLAEAGCSTLEIASITGHRTLKEIERYAREADQRTRATSAMGRVVSFSGATGKRPAKP